MEISTISFDKKVNILLYSSGQLGIDCSEMKKNDKWPFYDHFQPFFWQLYDYVSQNWGSDCHYKVLVKDFHIVGTKMARNGRKMAIYQMQILMVNLWFSQDLVQPQGTFCVITFEPIKILTH